MREQGYGKGLQEEGLQEQGYGKGLQEEGLQEAKVVAGSGCRKGNLTGSGLQEQGYGKGLQGSLMLSNPNLTPH